MNIPKAAVHLLPPLLRDLEATRETLSISEITVNLSSLEDVISFFFYLSFLSLLITFFL